MSNWIIDLMYTVLMTSITGSIFSIIWYLVGFALQKAGFLNIQYVLLRVIAIFWVVPFAFFFLKGINYAHWIFGGDLFAFSPAIHKFSVYFCVIWIAGAVVCFANYMFHLIQLRHRYRNTIVCDEELYEIFYRVCDELNVGRRCIELVWDYKQKVPAIMGVFHATIVLPTQDYTKQELHTIFLHEVMHYKQRDILFKNAYSILQSIHWFNPIVWWVGNKLPQLSEYACDYSVIPHVGGMRNYYETILGMAESKQRPLSFMAQLIESETSLVKRVVQMNRIYQKKNRSKMLAGCLITILFLTSTVMVYGATYATGEIYVKWYNATVIEEREENYKPVVYEEVYAKNIREELSGSANLPLNEEINGCAVSGMLEPMECYVSEPVYFEKGHMLWSVFPNSSGSIQVGILYPDGSGSYVVMHEEGGNVFEIEEAGEYCAYIRNIGNEDTELDAILMMIFQEE